MPPPNPEPCNFHLHCEPPQCLTSLATHAARLRVASSSCFSRLMARASMPRLDLLMEPA